MTSRDLFWFLGGAVAAVATLLVLWPALAAWRGRASARAQLLAWLPVGALAILVAIGVASIGNSPGALAPAVAFNASTPPSASASPGGIADTLPAGVADTIQAAGSTAAVAGTTSAGSMDAVLAKLESRLAAQGGSDSDWELLAKTYEFLKRPDDAALARRHQLPAGASRGATSSSPVVAPAGGGTPGLTVVALRGEVTLDPKLRGRVPDGTTLFIYARSVDSPGAPVAVLRLKSGRWPVAFELTDAQAMLSDRRLSTAGRVIVEARLSKSGQALAQPGDLTGSTPPMTVAGAGRLHIVIDTAVPAA